ncbi:uncharacterized protein [Nicotiana tomentosiformis]|uniref:uncharacterized protein n=1 Tax=Nicotiana tomentosiformis TaxID=4098 RepID=UPI00388C8CD9
MSSQDYDFIIGIDWLHKYHAVVDCRSKRVTFKALTFLHIVIQGERSLTSNIISAVVSRKMISQASLPLEREVEFPIEVIHRTTPISINPYRMAPTELKELKIQLQELLEKAVILTSVSPWGAPVLFVKKKDGYLRLCIDY